MPNPTLPGGSHGQTNVGYADRLHGLKLATVAKGSNELAILITAGAITFEVAAATSTSPIVGNGTLAGLAPLELHVQIIEAGVGVAGRWASSLEGETDADTIWHTLPATGEVIDCYEHFAANATIYIRAEAAITDGTLSYKLRCARDV